MNFLALIFFVWFFVWWSIVFNDTYRSDREGKTKKCFRFEIWNENIGIEKDSLIAGLSMFVYIFGGWLFGAWILMQLGWDVTK